MRCGVVIRAAKSLRHFGRNDAVARERRVAATASGTPIAPLPIAWTRVRCRPPLHAQIRAVYPLLAKQHHPDRHPDSKQVLARTQKLNAAHKTLSDQGAPA